MLAFWKLSAGKRVSVPARIAAGTASMTYIDSPQVEIRADKPLERGDRAICPS